MNPIASLGAESMGSVGQIIQLRQQLIERSRLLQELHSPNAAQTTDFAASSGGGFAETLRIALDGVNTTQTNAADLTDAYERGEMTDIASVMLARQEAGVAFEATLQVRNKLLSAYQEIMRMGV